MRPSAMTWISRLPIPTASTGPASTGRPPKSAVSRQSVSLEAPPPTRCTASTRRSLRNSACSRAHRWEHARLSRTQRTVWARFAGGDWPVERQKAAILAGMSPGWRNPGWSGSIRGPKGGAAAASETRSAYEIRAPQTLRHSWSSQRPLRLRMNRTVPMTPPSLVKPASLASLVVIGLSISSPASDHVPHEM